MAIEAVIFDIGGVLEATPSTGWRERWAAHLGLAPEEMARRLDPTFTEGSIGAIDLSQVERRVAEVLGLGPASLEAFMGDLWAEYLGTLNEELAAYFGGLRPRYRTGILSNSFAGAREREQAAYGFEDLCDVVVYSHEEGCRKPDPRFYRIVCERLDVAPDEAVFLDDREMCVGGARALGMKAIRFSDNEQAIRELEAHLNPESKAS
jgi:epoxide hydrolase-like predicted phosphatase